MDAFLIFGMGPAGLFLSRQLKRHTNDSIIAIGKNDDIGRFSNTIDHYYATLELGVIKNVVTGILEQYTKITPFICSDQYLSLLLESWPEAFDILDFRYPNNSLLLLFSDKEKVMDYCLSLGMRVPKGELLSKADINAFPIAIKPLVKRGVSRMGKITVIRDKQRLDNYKTQVLSLNENLSDYLVQPYIEGDNEFEYGYGGFFVNGTPIIDICFYQLRQYPQGVSCYTLEIENLEKRKEIILSVMPFIESTKYSGFLQFDIKEDKNTKLLYVLDVNPRPWGSVSMLTSHLDPNGSLWEKKKENILVQWRFPLKEILSFKNRLNVPYSLIRNIKLGRHYINTVDLLDRKDMIPFLMQPLISFMKLF